MNPVPDAVHCCRLVIALVPWPESLSCGSSRWRNRERSQILTRFRGDDGFADGHRLADHVAIPFHWSPPIQAVPSSHGRRGLQYPGWKTHIDSQNLGSHIVHRRAVRSPPGASGPSNESFSSNRVEGRDLSADAATASSEQVWCPLQFVGSYCGGQAGRFCLGEIGSHMPSAGDVAYRLTMSCKYVQ